MAQEQKQNKDRKEVKQMPSKHYVFSARTTEAGLKLLNQLKADRRVSWDELVIDAVCGHYDLDRSVMTLPRVEKPAKAGKPKKANKLDKAAFIRAANEPSGEAEGKATTTDEAKPKPEAKKSKSKVASTVTTAS